MIFREKQDSKKYGIQREAGLSEKWSKQDSTRNRFPRETGLRYNKVGGAFNGLLNLFFSFQFIFPKRVPLSYIFCAPVVVLCLFCLFICPSFNYFVWDGYCVALLALWVFGLSMGLFCGFGFAGLVCSGYCSQFVYWFVWVCWLGLFLGLFWAFLYLE